MNPRRTRRDRTSKNQSPFHELGSPIKGLTMRSHLRYFHQRSKWKKDIQEISDPIHTAASSSSPSRRSRRLAEKINKGGGRGMIQSDCESPLIVTDADQYPLPGAMLPTEPGGQQVYIAPERQHVAHECSNCNAAQHLTSSNSSFDMPDSGRRLISITVTIEDPRPISSRRDAAVHLNPMPTLDGNSTTRGPTSSNNRQDEEAGMELDRGPRMQANFLANANNVTINAETINSIAGHQTAATTRTTRLRSKRRK